MVRYTRHIILLLLPLAILGLMGCADIDTGPQLADQEVRNSLPSQEFTEATLVHTKNADTTFTLYAPVIYRYEVVSRADLFGGIKVTFYRDGYPGTVLTADSGSVLRNGKEMEAFSNVVVVTDSGLTLYTERLQWADADHLIRSDTTVTLITEEDTLYGDGLIATEDLRQRRLTNASGVTWRSVERDTTTGSPRASITPFFETERKPAAQAEQQPDTTQAGEADSLAVDSTHVQTIRTNSGPVNPFNTVPDTTKQDAQE